MLSGEGRPKYRISQLLNQRDERQPPAPGEIGDPDQNGDHAESSTVPKGSASGVPLTAIKRAASRAAPSEASGCWNQGARSRPGRRRAGTRDVSRFRSEACATPTSQKAGSLCFIASAVLSMAKISDQVTKGTSRRWARVARSSPRTGSTEYKEERHGDIGDPVAGNLLWNQTIPSAATKRRSRSARSALPSRPFPRSAVQTYGSFRQGGPAYPLGNAALGSCLRRGAGHNATVCRIMAAQARFLAGSIAAPPQA